MRELLGMELSRAMAAAKEAGHAVTAVETRSKKGVSDADEARVVRVKDTGDDSIELTYALFRTKLQGL